MRGPEGQVLQVFAAKPLPGNRMEVQFAPLRDDGTYILYISPFAFIDAHGNEMDQNGNGINGEVGEGFTDELAHTVTLARQPLKIIAQTPSVSINDALQTVEVTFSDPVLASSFSAADVKVQGPLGAVAVLGVESLSQTRFRINLQRATADGLYTLVIGSAITDPSGVAMDQDGDGIAGEIDDRYVNTIVLAGGGPQVVAIRPAGNTAAPVSSIDVIFSEPIDFATLTPIDILLTSSQGAIPVQSIQQLSPTVARLNITPQTREGSYTFRIGPNVNDLGGIRMDQDKDGQTGEATDDQFSSSFNIDATGPRITGSNPSGGINQPFSTIDLNFSESLDLASVSLSDMTLTGPNGLIAITSISVINPQTLRLSFTNQVQRGTYTLSVGPQISDLVGNEMDMDRDGVFGETADTYTDTIVLSLADLTVTNVLAPTSLENGQPFSISYEVKNSLAGVAKSPWTDRVVFSRDRFYGNADDVTIGAFTQTADLGSDQTYTRTATGTAPYGFTGEGRFFIVSDVTSAVAESDEGNNRVERIVNITFQRPPSDLIVDSISAPVSIGRGLELPVSFRVRNDGLATTDVAAWQDELFISVDATLDANDRRLATIRRQGRLDAGATYSLTQMVGIPEDLAIGNYFLILRTDAANEVVEPAAENNNDSIAIALAIDAAPLPNLVIDTIQTPNIGLRSGDTIDVQWTASNAGNLAVNGKWIDRILLSKDTTISSDDILLGQIEQSRTLAVDATYSGQFTARLPDGIAGDYYLIAVPDATNTIREGDGETEGVKSSELIPISVFPYADLTVSSVTAPPLIIGDPVDLVVSWKVSNTGSGPGRTTTWTDRVILSRNGILGDADDIVLGNFAHSGAMPSGSFYERTEVIPLPIATNGRFTLFVSTDIADEVFEVPGNQSNTGSPSHPVDVTTKPFADLVVESVQAPALAQAGGVIDLAWTVRNQGIGITDTSTWNDNIYITSDPTGSSGFRYIGTAQHAGPLPVEGSYTQRLTVALPRDISGPVYVFVFTGGPYEFIYTNNNAAMSAAVDVARYIAPELDLRGTLNALPDRVMEGQQLAVTWSVTNDGPQDLPDGWTDHLFLQSVANPARTIPLASYLNSNGIAAGRTVTRTEFIRFPRDAGQYRLVVRIDDGSSVVETDETNNLLISDPFILDTRPRPDLRALGLDAPSSVTSGTVIDFDFRVRNEGTADTPTGSSRWSDEVWLSTTANPNGRFLLLKRLPNGSALAFPGSPNGGPTEYRTQDSALLPANLGGNLYLVVMADAQGQVDEWPSEDNNFVAKAISIDRAEVPPPDLVTQSVTAPTDAFDRNNVTIRWKVANLGVGPTDPGSWNDSIWLTKEKGRPSSLRGDILLGVVGRNGVLQVGQSYEATATLAIPPGTRGAYFVTVFSDSSDGVYEEAFETNLNPDVPNDLDSSNLRSVPINILLSPPADLVVSNVDVPSAARGGKDVTVSWTVSNRGAVVTDRDRWADAVYLSSDNQLDASDQLVFALPHIGVLDVGQSYTQQATFTLPPSAQGSHFIVATNVDPSVAIQIEDPGLLSQVRAILDRFEKETGKPINEIKLADLQKFDRSTLLSILTGPAATVPTTVFEGPFTNNNHSAKPSVVDDLDVDLKIENVQATPTANSGDVINVAWDVRNIGTDRSWVGARFNYYVYVSKDPNFIESRASLVGSLVDSGESIEPSSSRRLDLPIRLPRGIEGKWYAHVIANAQLTVNGLFYGGWGKSEFPGWPAYFATRQWEGLIGPSDPKILNNRGSSDEINVTYREADLQFSNLQVTPPSSDSGGVVNVQWTVRNAGNRSTEIDSWNDVVFLSQDDTLDSSDLMIGGRRREGSLQPGASYSQSVDVQLPDNISGAFRILVYTDSPFGPSNAELEGRNPPYPELAFRIGGGGFGRVPEFRDEGNNTALTNVDVNAVERPNLQVLSVTSDARAQVGTEFLVRYIVKNNDGLIPTRQLPWQDSIYLSRDPVLDVNSDLLVGTVEHVQAIVPGKVVRSVGCCEFLVALVAPTTYWYDRTPYGRSDFRRGLSAKATSETTKRHLLCRFSSKYRHRRTCKL